MLGYMEKGIQTPMAQGRFTTTIWMIQWTRTSRLSIKNSLADHIPAAHDREDLCRGSHPQTLVIYRTGFNQVYYTLTLILLVKIVMCSKIPYTKFINCKCFDMRLRRGPPASE